jgi:hypothetical protein
MKICQIFLKNQGQPLVSLDFRGEIMFLSCLKTSLHPKSSLKNLIALETFRMSYDKDTPTCCQTMFSTNLNLPIYLSQPFNHCHLFWLHLDHSLNPSPPSQKPSSFFLSFARTFHQLQCIIRLRS